MSDKIKIIVNYGGKFMKNPMPHYLAGFKVAEEYDPDFMELESIIEILAEKLHYHLDSKVFYKNNGTSFSSGFTAVQNDDDIRNIARLAVQNDHMIELYVEHTLHEKHPDYFKSKEMVRNLERVVQPTTRSQGKNVENYEQVRKNQINLNENRMKELGIMGKAKELQEAPRRSPRLEIKFKEKRVIEIRPKSSRRKLGTELDKEREIETVDRSKVVGSNEVNVERSSTDGENKDGDIPKKRHRGLTRGIKLAKKRNRNDTVNIVIPEDRFRICGDDASNLITKCGVTVRNFAPMQYATWKQVPTVEKEKLWTIIKDKFMMDDGDVIVKDVVERQLADAFRNWKNVLHKTYYLPHDSFEEAVKHCPKEIESEKWQSLCQIFNSEKFKRCSEINKQNRAKQTMLHGTGSMSFARREYQLTNKDTLERPSMSTLFKETHWSKKKMIGLMRKRRRVMRRQLLKSRLSRKLEKLLMKTIFLLRF